MNKTQTTIQTIGTLVTLLTLLAPVPPSRARDLTVSACTTGQVVAERSFDPLSPDDALALAHLEFGLELDEILPGLNLELAWEAGTKRAELFAGDLPWLQTELMLHGIVLSASWRLPVARWLHAVARAGGTLDFVRLRIEDDGEVLLSDWASARLGIFATLGVEFVLPRNLWRKWFGRPAGDDREGFTLGLRLEAGWSHRQPFDFDGMQGPAPGGEDPARPSIDRVAADLGSVHLDGFLFRAGLVVFF